MRPIHSHDMQRARARARAQRPVPVVCTACGQRADEPPGFKLTEYDTLEAVFVDDAVFVGDNLPQRLVCQTCGKATPVPRGSITLRRPE